MHLIQEKQDSNLVNNELRQELSLAYQILSQMGWDDLTYTHISARVPGQQCFYIQPFGLLYEEVTAENLICVDFDGIVQEGAQKSYNPTGYAIHTSVYQARPDINAIFHIHTPAGIAISSLKCGLLPLSQHALVFYENIGSYAYDSLVLDPTEQTQKLITALGKAPACLLQNHGTLTCGKNLAEAFFFTYHLERACQVQVQLAAVPHENLHIPARETCLKARTDMLSFEKNLGARDWAAAIRCWGVSY